MLQKVMSHVCRQPALLAGVRRFCSATTVDPTRLEKTINHVTLLGRVGAEPQKRGNAEHPVVIFSMATHNNYRYDSGELMQKTEWHRICVFKPALRETVYTYLKKGQRVMVQGRVSYGEYVDNDGSTKPSTAVIAQEVVFFQ